MAVIVFNILGEISNIFLYLLYKKLINNKGLETLPVGIRRSFGDSYRARRVVLTRYKKYGFMLGYNSGFPRRIGLVLELLSL